MVLEKAGKAGFCLPVKGLQLPSDFRLYGRMHDAAQHIPPLCVRVDQVGNCLPVNCPVREKDAVSEKLPHRLIAGSAFLLKRPANLVTFDDQRSILLMKRCENRAFPCADAARDAKHDDMTPDSIKRHCLRF